MFRDILSGSRAIFLGLVFFVLVVGRSLLYSWHVHRTTEAESLRTDVVSERENRNETRTALESWSSLRLCRRHTSAWELSPVSASRTTSALNLGVKVLRLRFAIGYSFQ